MPTLGARVTGLPNPLFSDEQATKQFVEDNSGPFALLLASLGKTVEFQTGDPPAGVIVPLVGPARSATAIVRLVSGTVARLGLPYLHNGSGPGTSISDLAGVAGGAENWRLRQYPINDATFPGKMRLGYYSDVATPVSLESTAGDWADGELAFWEVEVTVNGNGVDAALYRNATLKVYKNGALLLTVTNVAMKQASKLWAVAQTGTAVEAKSTFMGRPMARVTVP